MKHALVLLPVITLAACDRPTSMAELSCDMDTYWRRANVLYLENSYQDNDPSGTKINVKVTTYNNYAKVTFDNITTTLEKVVESKDNGEFGKLHITYKGNFPGSERTALLYVYSDITKKEILQYSISFMGEKNVYNGQEFSVNRSCIPVKDEYKGKRWSAAVPFNHKYKMPNKIERCITEITETVYCNNENCDSLFVIYKGKRLDLSQQDALSISSNWDYKNMKRYHNDGKLEEHEKDACDVLDRLNKFIHDTSLDSDKSENI